MKILLVDDSKTVRYVIIKILNDLGYHDILEAGNVQDALKILKEKAIGLILSDYNMPRETGLDLLKAVRANVATQNVPFVMVTTVHDKSVIMEAVKAGMQFYVLKPADINVFYQKLSSLAQTHNIQAPVKKASLKTGSPMQLSADSAPQKDRGECAGETLSQKCIDEIVEHFFLIYNGELTMDDFNNWMAVEVFGSQAGADTMKLADTMIEELRASAGKGIREMLSGYKVPHDSGAE